MAQIFVYRLHQTLTHHGRSGRIICRTEGDPKLFQKTGEQLGNQLSGGEPLTDFVAELLSVLLGRGLRPDACTVNQHDFVDVKGKLAVCHFDNHATAERMAHQRQLADGKLLHKLQHEVHIIIHIEGPLRLTGFTEAGHIQSNYEILLRKQLDQLTISVQTGSPTVQEQHSFALTRGQIVGINSVDDSVQNS